MGVMKENNMVHVIQIGEEGIGDYLSEKAAFQLPSEGGHSLSEGSGQSISGRDNSMCNDMEAGRT